VIAMVSTALTKRRVLALVNLLAIVLSAAVLSVPLGQWF